MISEITQVGRKSNVLQETTDDTCGEEGDKGWSVAQQPGSEWVDCLIHPTV